MDDTQSNVYGSKVRDIDEIQKAHDLIEAVATGEIRLRLSPEQQIVFVALTECLCWILSHNSESGEEFGLKLNFLIQDLERQGVVMTRRMSPIQDLSDTGRES